MDSEGEQPASRRGQAVEGWQAGVDARVGDFLEQRITRHHSRRLARIGAAERLSPHDPDIWAIGDPPPRPGNSLHVLIDGSEALPRMAEAIRTARSEVLIASWSLSPWFLMERNRSVAPLRELLAEAAERVPVRVLMWGGPPLPLFRPWRLQQLARLRELCEGTRIECRLDSRERPLHCHHEKLLVIDGLAAFVGGIDFTWTPLDRFDSPAHPLRDSVGWHDVAAELRGPSVADVAAHIVRRWKDVTGENLQVAPPQRDQGRSTVQVVATVPEHIYPSMPGGSFRILESYIRALRAARRFIYIENQFLWAPEIVSVLVDKLAQPPDDRFRLLLLLPVHPNSGRDSTLGQIAMLAEADSDHNRHLLACSLYSRAGEDHRSVYVHAKVGIVDDQWMTLGSANLNDHSLFNDTEVNVVTDDADVIRQTRLRLWAEHLETTVDQVAEDPADVIDEGWRPTAFEQARRLADGRPLTHRLVRLPHVSKRSERLLGPVQSTVVDG